MFWINPSNVYCQQTPIKTKAGHKSVPMTILCPPNINSNFIQWIYIILFIPYEKYSVLLIGPCININEWMWK